MQGIPQGRSDRLSRVTGPAATRSGPVENHLLDYLASIYRHRYLAATVFAVVVVAAGIRASMTTPLYRAQARVMIEIEDDQTTALSGVLGGENARDPEPFYQTQFRILTGRELARRTVSRLELGKQPEFAGLAGDQAALVSAFVGRVSADPIKSSRLVDVGFVSADPELSARAANQLARDYVERNAEMRRANLMSSITWLDQELERQRGRVEASERAMATYRERQNALSLQDSQNIVVARLNSLNDAVTKARTALAQKESLYEQVKELTAVEAADTIPAIQQNNYIQSLKSHVADLERERANLAERYGERHPEIIKVNASIRDARRQLESEISKALDGIRNDYQTALAEERSLERSLDEQKGAVLTLSRKNVSYTVLEREAQSNRQVYESLLQRQKELQVLASSRGNNVRLVDEAEVPRAPFVPDIKRSLVMATLAGLALALALVGGLTYLDDTVKTPEDVAQKLQVPFLGMVPKVPGTKALLSSDVPHTFGEAFRSLRTALAFSNGATSGRVIVVTSSQPLEGKTTTASNLAIALALGGEKVLLVDADLRRPNLHKTLGIENTVGLSHLLTDQASARDAIRRCSTPNLWVMTAGMVPPNPSELLASDRMKTLLSPVHGWFDWVIVDTPPVLAVTDAVILAPLAAGVAFVIRSEMTPRRHVRRAIETLMTGQPKLHGVVLNGVDLERNKYYYSRYYGYEHTQYYKASAAS
ncbi:MAG TPA: polysaccharide biosynthesis tyrosine autokinase [Vicinamibacterales bacterium]|nr:polysaccharide biosynthesis tyrosine autokinase [Vicinamibacterales bacterium]